VAEHQAEHQEDPRSSAVADVAEVVVEGALEAAELTNNVASCLSALPDLDCSILACDPGCV